MNHWSLMTRRIFHIAGLGLVLLNAGALMAQRGRQSSGSTMPTAGASDLIVHGSVMLSGGTALGRLVAVERICTGRSREAVFADAKGRFSFNLGVIDRGGPNNLNSGAFSSAGDMRTCVIRASLAGYHPQMVALEGIIKSGKGNLGEMVLQPLGKQAFIVSATDAEIPKNARKDYDAGLDAAAKSKWPEAIAAMKKAAAAYPKFATAWLGIGMLEASGNDFVAALHSYTQAIAADEKFAPAYVELAALHTAAGDWNKAIESAGKATALDPDAFPRAYYLSAISNVRLNQADAAEKSAGEGIRVDTDHEIPDLEYIEGVLLLSKGDVPEGRKQLEKYLSHAPGGVNVANARQQLAETAESKVSNR
jgi:tetratricopeptide (TPR) repeat protein